MAKYTKEEKRNIQKFNYQAYRGLGYPPKVARKWRNRTPQRTLTESLKKKMSTKEIPSETIKLIPSKAMEPLNKGMVDTLKEYGLKGKQITSLNALNPRKKAHIIRSLKDIKKAAGNRFKEAIEHLTIKKGGEKEFWKAIQIMYTEQIGVKP